MTIRLRPVLVTICCALLFGCAGPPASRDVVVRDPSVVRATIARSIPAGVADPAGWAADLYAAFAVQAVEPTAENICAAIAVIEQESSFRVDPVVPGLPKIAWAEIDRRAERAGVPALVVHTALRLDSPDGRSYAARIDSVRTEKQLSDVFQDLMRALPLGSTLFGGLNPIRTRGPMQVNVAFVRRYTKHPYPYPVRTDIEDELFTRRGGLFFGVAHLLDYQAPYDRFLYRFADFNAGQYASRNAAFQNAVSEVSGIPLVPDGALIAHDDEAKAGSTELATRAAARHLDLGEGEVHRALEQGRSEAFERTELYGRVFAQADRLAGHAMPRAIVPQIELQGPKISRPLTTRWYANSVDARFRRCLQR